MKVLTEIKEYNNHSEGIVIFPNYLKNEVIKIISDKIELKNFNIVESEYRGYSNLSIRFETTQKASEWINNISDLICSSI